MDNAWASFFWAACAELVCVVDLHTVQAQALTDVVTLRMVSGIYLVFVVDDTERSCIPTVR